MDEALRRLFADCRGVQEADWPAAPFASLASCCQLLDDCFNQGTGLALAFFPQAGADIQLRRTDNTSVFSWNGVDMASSLSGAFMPEEMGKQFFSTALKADYYDGYKGFEVRIPNGGFLPTSSLVWKSLGDLAETVEYKWEGRTVAW